MAGGYKKLTGKDGNTFSSTNQPKNSGRKKKIYTILKEKGFSGEDIRTAFGEMAFYTVKELQSVYENDELPVITRIVANQYYSALADGDWNLIKEILEHVIGKPKQPVSVDTDMAIAANIDDIFGRIEKDIKPEKD